MSEMIFRLLIISCGLLLISPAASKERRSEQLQLIDLTDDFAREWDRATSLDEVGRIAAFKAYFTDIIPGFYSQERFSSAGAEHYNQRFLKALNQFPKERVDIAEVSRRSSTMLAPAQASFEAEFGPMKGFAPIYLVHSLASLMVGRDHCRAAIS